MNDPTAIVAADLTGTIIAWSGHATEWFGYTESAALGRLVDDLVPDEFRTAHRSGLDRAMSGGARQLEGAATHLPVLHANGGGGELKCRHFITRADACVSVELSC